jgi:hypothetical protein
MTVADWMTPLPVAGKLCCDFVIKIILAEAFSHKALKMFFYSAYLRTTREWSLHGNGHDSTVRELRSLPVSLTRELFRDSV